MRKPWLFVLFLLLVVVTVPPHGRAQERRNVEEDHGDVVALAEKPKAPLWDVSLEGCWLPESGIRAGGGELSMEEVRGGFARRFHVASRLDLSSGVRYSLLQIDAPDSARLPESLQAVFVSLGGEYRSSERLTLGLRVSPGISSDFKGVTSDDVRVPVVLNARYQLPKGWTVLAGLIYTAGSSAYPVLPIVGALYAPSEAWNFALGFPRTGVLYRSRRGAQWYLGVESTRGEYRLHDPRVGGDVISYRDFRGGAGVDLPVLPFLKLGVAGGYAFARTFAFYEGEREDVRLDSTPFAKVQMKIEW